MANQDISKNVQQYYSEKLKTKNDVKTTVAYSEHRQKKIEELTKTIHPAVKQKHSGAGLVTPECLQGLNILDAGCGAGMDSFAVAKLAGPTANIIGIDMTDESLNIAKEHIEHHRLAFGYEKANTKFVKGYIEDIKTAGIEDYSMDVVISDGVVNLTQDKRKTLNAIFKALKIGGEFHFSDYFASKSIPEELQQNKELWGQCLSGTLYWKRLFDLARDVGFCTPLQVDASPITIDCCKIASLLDGIKFMSITYRLFKCSEKTDEGPITVTYNGGIDGSEETFHLSSHMQFEKSIAKDVPSEIGCILKESRFQNFFTFGDTIESDLQVDLQINPFGETS